MPIAPKMTTFIAADFRISRPDWRGCMPIAPKMTTFIAADFRISRPDWPIRRRQETSTRSHAQVIDARWRERRALARSIRTYQDPARSPATLRWSTSRPFGKPISRSLRGVRATKGRCAYCFAIRGAPLAAMCGVHRHCCCDREPAAQVDGAAHRMDGRRSRIRGGILRTELYGAVDDASCTHARGAIFGIADVSGSGWRRLRLRAASLNGVCACAGRQLGLRGREWVGVASSTPARAVHRASSAPARAVRAYARHMGAEFVISPPDDGVTSGAKVVWRYGWHGCRSQSFVP